MKNKSGNRLRVSLAVPYLEGIDLLIGEGLYECKTEIIRDALRRLFNQYELSCISDCFLNPVEVA